MTLVRSQTIGKSCVNNTRVEVTDLCPGALMCHLSLRSQCSVTWFPRVTLHRTLSRVRITDLDRIRGTDGALQSGRLF